MARPTKIRATNQVLAVRSCSSELSRSQRKGNITLISREEMPVQLMMGWATASGGSGRGSNEVGGERGRAVAARNGEEWAAAEGELERMQGAVRLQLAGQRRRGTGTCGAGDRGWAAGAEASCWSELLGDSRGGRQQRRSGGWDGVASGGGCSLLGRGGEESGRAGRATVAGLRGVGKAEVSPDFREGRVIDRSVGRGGSRDLHPCSLL